MELEGKKINFLGDSITEGYGTSGPEAGFVYLLGQSARLAASRNYGIGGTRYARQRTPSENPLHDLDFCRRVEELDPDADLIVIFGGTNDYGHGDAPFGSFSDRTPDTFCGACRTVFERALTRWPEAAVAVVTPTHRLDEANPFGDGSKRAPGPALRAYVEAIRSIAAWYSLPLLDLYAAGGLQPEVPAIRERFCPDGLHPNDAGHRLLARKMEAFLRTL